MIASGWANFVWARTGLLAARSEETVYELARLDELQDRQGLLVGLVAVAIAIIAWVIYWYRRESVSLRPSVTLLLLVLRVAAIAGIALFFLRLEKRTDLTTREDSRVAILVDVSQSMGLADDDQASGESATRSGAVIRAFEEGTLLGSLRQAHDVDVASFSETVHPLTRLQRDAPPDPAEDPASEGPRPPESPLDWNELLLPTGYQTCIGQSLREYVAPASGSTLAGIVLISDGGQNAGEDPDAAIALARQRGIAISTIGVGSHKPLRNARLVDVITPSRAQQGEGFALTAVIQSHGMEQGPATVSVYRRGSGEDAAAAVHVAGESIVFAADGDAQQLRFELQEDVPDVVTYTVRLEGMQGDQTASDNDRELTVDIVDRKLRVLLVASGATREYRFVRNMLRRDSGVVLDVLLQSSPQGISQDADTILHAFPDTRKQLFEYDAIVGFDPDWKQLDVQQVALLEAWVSEAAGGLILAAGPVHTADFIDSVEHSQLRSLYPVVFRRGLTLLDDSRYGSDTPWPIELTPEGQHAEFLQLADDPVESLDAWSEFQGVFGYFSVRGVKPGATVYGEYSDPQASVGGKLPPYFVGQFYGAGRVFYMASGEMWRIRALDPGYMEVFYTRLLRHVTQGRLLRGSARGLLMVEQDRYAVGDFVTIRAQVYDEQHRPLNRARVDVQVMHPGRTVSLVALPSSEQEGVFQGQLQVLETGTFQLALSPPGETGEALTRRFEVTIPDFEQRNPARNETLLRTLAEQTDGVYYESLALAATGSDAVPSLAARLPDRSEERVIRGAPDRTYDERLRTWLLGWIAGALSLEWLLRRLNKLA